MFAARYAVAMAAAQDMEAEVRGICQQHHATWDNFGDFLDAFVRVPVFLLGGFVCLERGRGGSLTGFGGIIFGYLQCFGWFFWQ